jgi:hypothetical protein
MPYPGRNTYKNGHIEDDVTFQLKILNAPRVQLSLHKLGHDMIEVAQLIYEASSKHDAEDLTPDYNESFSVEEIGTAVKGIRVVNNDRTAEWVEFGAHAGGKTAVLKYRVLGRAADVMEAKAAH